MNLITMMKVFIHLASFSPLLVMYIFAFSDQLGADPVEEIIHFTGVGAFNLLLLTLSTSPLAKHFKASAFLKVRRLLGLYCFMYALCHVLNFIFFEIQFDWSLVLSEIIERPYITIGMVAFVLLLMLSVTSVPLMKRKMGKRWQQLHNSIYLVVLLVAIHFYWSVKSSLTSPILYFIVVLLLLALRYKKIKKLFKGNKRI